MKRAILYEIHGVGTLQDDCAFSMEAIASRCQEPVYVVDP